MAHFENDATGGVFAAGTMVMVTLNQPREKYWGAILGITPAGVSLRGIDLNSFDDFMRQVVSGDEVFPNFVFFPMHRVERIEIDSRSGEIPSMQERFQKKTGKSFRDHFLAAEAGR